MSDLLGITIGQVVALSDDISTTNATKLSASNFKSFILKETKPDSSQIWTITWINGTQEFKYDISFPKGISAFKGGEYTSKAQLEGAFPTGITSEEFAMVQDNEDFYIATYNAGAWKYKLLNNKVVFRKTDTTIDYKFSDEDDSKYKLFVNLSDIKGDKLKHQWDGTKLKLENTDGSFDDGVNLIGKPPKSYWFDNTKLSFDDGNGGITDPVDLKGMGSKGVQGDSPSIYDVYSNSDGDIIFKIKTGTELTEVPFSDGIKKILQHVNINNYIGEFDINNLPSPIVKGNTFVVANPFTLNGKVYPVGSVIIANKDKTTGVLSNDFDYYANKSGTVSVKVEEEIIEITQDTYQLTLNNYDNNKDSCIISVSGLTREGSVLLEEGIAFNIINNNIVNITTTKLINGDKVKIRKFLGTKLVGLRTWVSGTNYFKDDMVRSPLTGGIYLCLKDILNSTVDPSASADGWTNIGQVSKIASFVLNAPYGVEDVVLSNGTVWQCIKEIKIANKTPDSDAEHFKSLIPAGDSAYQTYLKLTSDNPKKTESEWLSSLKGIGLKYRQTYSATERYYLNEYVSYANRIYVCISQDALGITNITPDSDNTKWGSLFDSAGIDATSLIDDTLNSNASKVWSTAKSYNVANLKADKDNVILKDAQTPFIATTDNQPMTLGATKQLISQGINMDMITDGVEFKRSHNDFDNNLKAKLIAIQDNMKGTFTNKAELQAKFPDGNSVSKNNDVCIVLNDGLNHWFYWMDGSWHDSGSSSSTIDGLAKVVYDPRNVSKDMFDINNQTLSPERQTITQSQKDVLLQLAPNKLDSKEIISNTLKHNTGLVYDVNLDRHIYKPYLDKDTIGFFSFTKLKRIDLTNDTEYSNKYYIVFDRDLRISCLFQPESKQWVNNIAPLYSNV